MHAAPICSTPALDDQVHVENVTSLQGNGQTEELSRRD